MRWTHLDGALIGFDRATGTNVMYASERTRELRRVAPRSLQIGLLTPCNLACSFCYRDREAPSRLDRAFLVDLLQRAAAWGVLEVAFGGGEPLLFKGFAELIEELHATTPLGLNVTTNGMLLTPELVARLRGKIGEYRLSIYEDNDWRTTLARYRDEPIGVNWLVTPANVGEVAERVRDFLARGARNVLLLGYKGADRSLILDGAGLATLRAQLAALDGAPLLLDICWHPQLADLPHLFPRTDCGAGDDILVITADRAVQACSFADRRIPFETFDDLQIVYRMLRAAKPHANTGGCTRELFQITSGPVASGRVLPASDRPQLFAWQGRASSNSGAYTILARFKTEDAARLFERELDEAYQAHLDFMVEDSDRAMDQHGTVTPPFQALAARHGFEWPADAYFAWEGDSFGDRAEADQLEIERFGNNLIVHLGYGQDMGAMGLERFSAVIGAERFVQMNDPFRVVVLVPDEKSADKVGAIAQGVDIDGLAFDSAQDDGDDLDEIDEPLPYEQCEYRVEIVGPAGTRQLGFSSTIGGLSAASRLVLELARVKGLTFELDGGAPPRMT